MAGQLLSQSTLYGNVALRVQWDQVCVTQV